MKYLYSAHRIFVSSSPTLFFRANHLIPTLEMLR